jgi:hypothetical protein
MRFPFRPILIGLLIGALVFFIPFRFPFFLFFILFFLFGRFFFRPWRRRYGWRHPGYDYRNDILPIDGYYRPSESESKEPARKINIQ